MRDPDKRDQIINLLPLPKARELGKRLGVEGDKDPYGNLRSAASDGAALPVLFSFFGVVRDVLAPTDTAASTATADAGYGLFDHHARGGGESHPCPCLAAAQSHSSYAHRIG